MKGKKQQVSFLHQGKHEICLFLSSEAGLPFVQINFSPCSFAHLVWQNMEKHSFLKYTK